MTLERCLLVNVFAKQQETFGQTAEHHKITDGTYVSYVILNTISWKQFGE